MGETLIDYLSKFKNNPVSRVSKLFLITYCRSTILHYLLNRVSMWIGHLLWWLPGRNASDRVFLYFIWQLEQQERAQTSPGNTHILQGMSAAMSLTGNHTVKEEAVLLPGAMADWRPSQPNELSSGQGACRTRGALCPHHHITNVSWLQIMSQIAAHVHSFLIRSITAANFQFHYLMASMGHRGLTSAPLMVM